MAHDAADLSLISFFNASPGDSGASFWNGSAGLASDEQGNVYVVSANGDFDGDFGAARYDESVLRFSPEPGLLLADQFTPFNKLILDAADLDLGSSGALLLPAAGGRVAGGGFRRAGVATGVRGANVWIGRLFQWIRLHCSK
jgi:hypothetical protein